MKLESVFDSQLKQPQGGRDDLVLGPVLAQGDELEVRVHRGLVVEKDATLKRKRQKIIKLLHVILHPPASEASRGVY